MIRRVILVMLCAALAIAFPGPSGAQEKTAPAPPAPVKDPEVVDAGGYAAMLAKHRGKPVMVNFWATWCEPCREELPLVNELAKKYAAQGLVVIGVSVDDDGELTMVRRFLARVNPAFPNYRKKMGDFEAFNKSIDPQWRGSIPATFFYSPDGQRVASLIGEQKRETFEKSIQELLARPAPR